MLECGVCKCGDTRLMWKAIAILAILNFALFVADAIAAYRANKSIDEIIEEIIREECGYEDESKAE